MYEDYATMASSVSKFQKWTCAKQLQKSNQVWLIPGAQFRWRNITPSLV